MRDTSKKPWFFHWVNGGYNYVMAESREEAIVLANEMAKKTVLKLDETSLVVDLSGKRCAAEEEKYRGMFD